MTIDRAAVESGLDRLGRFDGDVAALVDDLTGPGPVVCLTGGVSGSGKTALARVLEEAGFVRLSIDQVRWEAGGPDADWDDDYDAAAERSLEERLGELVAAGRDVVVDVAACSRDARDRHRGIVAGAGGRLVLVHLEADPTTLRRRLAGRAWAHADDVPVPDDVLDRYLAGFAPPSEDERPHRFRTG